MLEKRATAIDKTLMWEYNLKITFIALIVPSIWLPFQVWLYGGNFLQLLSLNDLD